MRRTQVDGATQILFPGDVECAAAARFGHIPMATLEKLPKPMRLIKIVPGRVDYLCSDLKEKGLSSRQHLEWA